MKIMLHANRFKECGPNTFYHKNVDPHIVLGHKVETFFRRTTHNEGSYIVNQEINLTSSDL